MPRIPFISARFFDPNQTERSLEIRFRDFLRRIREAEDGADAASGEVDGNDGDGLHIEDLLAGARRATDPPQRNILSPRDLDMVRRRARRIMDLRHDRSGLAHLNEDRRKELSAFRDGVHIVPITSEHRADEIAADLHGQMPWMGPATELMWLAMRRSVREGHVGLRIPPLLLDGPPGIGKSHFARRIGALLQLPVTVIEATGENAGFGVVGLQRGWGSAGPGRLLQAIIRDRIGNPILVIDEIEKAGRPRSEKGGAFGLAEALLPLIEPMTAKAWTCPYYQVTFDMSWVGWVLTSNDLASLPEPLLSRLSVVRLPEVSVGDLVTFAMATGRSRGLSQPSLDAVAGALMALPPAARPSLRTVMRMLDRAADLENKPMVM